MSSAPSTLDAQCVSFGAPTPYHPQAIAVDDCALLDGAVSVWVTLRFARRGPAVPETQRALERAETLFLVEVERCGFTVAQLEERLRELATAGLDAGGSDSPLGS
jgi:hypothetical protein